jgi:predicted alpha/beta hydrolase family esterase
MRPVVLLPGIGNSGPDHWQSRWQEKHAGVRRVMQRSWDQPVCAEWVETLDQAVRLTAWAPAKNCEITLLVSSR